MTIPQCKQEKVAELLATEFSKIGRIQPKVSLLAIRGYYLDSMGAVGENDRGIYDDAIFLYSPSCFKSYNANSDPSRSGVNADTGKGFAVLQCGIYDYKIGIHGISKPPSMQYRALVQARQVVIKRDGSPTLERGFFGINIHRGGVSGTSSLGCQTIVPAQYKEFFEAVESELNKYGQNVIPYCLIEVQNN